MKRWTVGFAVVVVLVRAGQVGAAVQYTITDLGTLGGNYSVAETVNSSGQVAGSSETGDPYMPSHAFLYSEGVMYGLGLDGEDSIGRGINDSGHVVGLLSPSYRAFLYSDGTMHDLGTLGGDESQAWDINNSDEIAGSARNAAGEEHAFLYTGGVMYDLGTLGGNFSVAHAINNSTEVAGVAKDTGGSMRAFVYKQGTMYDLGVLHGESIANDINDFGQVVGFVRSSPVSHAFLYSDGTVHDLGTFDGRSSFAMAINNSGQIVGISRDEGPLSNWRPFLYSAGTAIDLNDLLLPTGLPWELLIASDINDSGQIVGYGRIGGEEYVRAFLLTPIPEPSTLVLFTVGALALLAYAWRRSWWAAPVFCTRCYESTVWGTGKGLNPGVRLCG